MPPRTDKKTTMGDVARHAGVSQMTVSRVMRRSGAVSDDVRDRVMLAARELGYLHNRLATALRTRSSPLVAVILPTLGNRVFAEILSGVNDAVAKVGLRAVSGVTEYSEAQEEALVRDLLSWQPRGLILPGLEHSQGTRAALAAAQVEVVEVMDIDGDPVSVAIGVSQSAAGRDMASHLIAKGYRRFAYLGAQGGRDLRAKKRLDAFAATVLAAGATLLSPRIDDAPSSMVVGRRMTASLLSEESPDAIYFSNDDLAAGGLMHCLAHGIEVPRKIALAGFNGLAFTEALPLRLTTTRTPRYPIGYEAGRLLASGTDGTRREPRVIDMGLTLIPGETS
jgi:LacI family gluconate utilization system Gnt-I transcriptional repressor